MQLVAFLIGDKQIPVYRAISDSEGQVFAALLGRDFHFPLEAGDPMDEILLDVLTSVSASSDFYFVPPADAAVLGTFEMRDMVLAAAEPEEIEDGSRRRRRIH